MDPPGNGSYAAPVRTLAVHRLGRVPYDEAHALQKRLQRARQQGEIPDTLLLLEHPPVVTLGRAARSEHLRLGAALLRARGFEIHETGRGGDVTYHGPGQLVAYPIVDLNPDRRDVRRYVRDLEETMIAVAARWGVGAGRIEGLNGTWVGDRKIGAIGVRISRWVTMHGFAFNVTTDLGHFDVIVPCGIPDKTVTSLSKELGREVPLAEVEDAAVEAFCRIFDADPHAADRLPDLAEATP